MERSKHAERKKERKEPTKQKLQFIYAKFPSAGPPRGVPPDRSAGCSVAPRRRRLRWKQPLAAVTSQPALQNEREDEDGEDDEGEEREEDSHPELPKRGLAPSSKVSVLGRAAIDDVRALTSSMPCVRSH